MDIVRQKQIREWTLLGLVGTMALVANLPPTFLERIGIEQGLLMALLGLMVVFALFLYVRLFFFLLYFLLAIGANLPEQWAHSLGISQTPMLIALIAMVALSVLNYTSKALPTGLEPKKSKDNPEATQMLVDAISKRNLSYFKTLMTMDFDVDLPGGDGFTPLMHAAQKGEFKMVQMLIKRIFDILVSSVALAVLSPLLLVVAVLVKVSSPGPVLFKQERVGLHGHPFNMLKFRSMVANAESLRKGLEAKNEQSGPVFKIAHDPRITPVGRVIRKLSIDELPQLLNVLRSEMSLVGPRPPLASEVARYEPWQRRRLSVRPGITCEWQVSGRSETSFETWMYQDMHYIDHWSFLQDLKLLLRTLPAVLSSRGAS